MAPLKKPLSKPNGFLNMIGLGTASCNKKDHMEIQVTEIKDSGATDFCKINLPTTGECSQTGPSSCLLCLYKFHYCFPQFYIVKTTGAPLLVLEVKSFV